MVKLSAFIITFNEEKNIRQCLESISFCDEIIVVDSESTDGTKEIVESFPQAKFITQKWLGYSKQKQMAMDLCSHNWCLSMDADEWLDNGAKEEIEGILNSTHNAKGYYFKRYDQFFDKFPPKLMKKDKFLRLVQKSHSYIKQVSVHEVLLLKSNHKPGLLMTKMLHSGYNSPEVYTEKFEKYARLRVEASSKKASIFNMIFIIPFETFRQLFLKRRIFWGWRGLYLSYLYIVYAFKKKIYLLKNGISL